MVDGGPGDTPGARDTGSGSVYEDSSVATSAGVVSELGDNSEAKGVGVR